MNIKSSFRNSVVKVGTFKKKGINITVALFNVLT
jgi:hypothetical protein